MRLNFHICTVQSLISLAICYWVNFKYILNQLLLHVCYGENLKKMLKTCPYNLTFSNLYPNNFVT